MTKLVLLLISAYQKGISPLIDAILGKGNTCRYSPTCSVYMFDAVKKYGVLKGIYMGIKRIGRCHPYTKGGYDPVR